MRAWDCSTRRPAGGAPGGAGESSSRGSAAAAPPAQVTTRSALGSPPSPPPTHTHTLAAPQLLMDLAEAANLRGKVGAMFDGEHINSTEDRAVLHVATRARRDQVRHGSEGGWGGNSEAARGEESGGGPLAQLSRAPQRRAAAGRAHGRQVRVRV